ncbi:hypothetical protein ES707_03418 [subsurface metagenome]
MAEEKLKSRRLKVLETLSKFTEPTGAAEIAGIIGETSLNVGNDLYHLGKGGLTQKPDKKQSLWLITENGKKYIEHPPVPSIPPTPTPSTTVSTPPSTPPTVEPPTEEPTVTIPSQSDLFRKEGDLLGVGAKKGSISLDVIVQWVERTADLDNLTSVWNALTEMGVANDIKKRWIKLYAQDLPGKEIPEELKEKLEGDQAEKVKIETGDIPPKPRRFSVVSDEIMGDPEGDLTFKEAVQYLAQKKGASPAEAESLALQLSKQGPEMLTSIMTMLTPLITKEPPKTDNTMVLALQGRIEQLADDKHKAEMEALRAEIRSGQRSPEADQQIQALSQQITDMKETLNKQELARIQEQNQSLIGGLTAKIGKLEEQIAAGIQGKQAESKIGLMSETVKGIFEEAKGARQDLKSMAPTFLSRGAPTKKRTAGEKVGFSTGLDRGIERAQAAGALEEELFFSGQSKG